MTNDNEPSINKKETENQAQNMREYWEEQELEEAMARRENVIMRRLLFLDEEEMLFI